MTPKEQLLLEQERIMRELALLEDEDSSSPIFSPVIEKKLEIGQQVAFIHSKTDVVPATIISANKNGTYDLDVYVPTSQTVLKFKKAAFKRKQTTELVRRTYKQVRIGNPKAIFSKQMVALSEAQKGAEGIVQTHINTYVQVSEEEVPRFHSFHTSIIGTFFDPSPYQYQVYCWIAAGERQGIKFPETRELHPSPDSCYQTFNEAFNRFFKEYYKGMSRNGNKWNLVEIRAIER